MAHWVWGFGWLDTWGVLDFAGGIVIHTTAGVSSLVVAIMIGKRLDFEDHHGDPHPHSIPLATVGAALLWIGWYGFNAGSAMVSGPVAASTVACTTQGIPKKCQ